MIKYIFSHVNNDHINETVEIVDLNISSRPMLLGFPHGTDNSFESLINKILVIYPNIKIVTIKNNHDLGVNGIVKFNIFSTLIFLV